MFETSWGEIVVLTGLCLALVGRKDLPKASRFVGEQVGRVVGLLQGARVRADRFAAQNELRQLQNELRAGLRDLDAVKAEIAIAASSRGTIGRSLGPTVSSVNRRNDGTTTSTESNDSVGRSSTTSIDAATVSSNFHRLPTNSSTVSSRDDIMPTTTTTSSATTIVRPLAPRSHAVAAVAQDEWEKQGIGFVSKAEQRRGGTADTGSTAPPGGATLLANLIQQSLIFDQHDRVVQEQQEALQSKVDDARRRHSSTTTETETTGTDSKCQAKQANKSDE